jgi:hypothetical protein
MALADFKNSIVTQDKFSTTFDKFDRGVQTSARGLDKLGGVLSSGGVGMLFGATAGVAGAAAIGKVVWSLGELGAQSLTTKSSYESMMRSVGQSTALLDQLKTAAGGTVAEMKLMQLTNTALAGSTGALSSEMAGALPKLLEAGRAAALLNPSLGDAEFMFQSLITGIKRGSPMLIDNTGIVLKLGEATEAYAASVGKSVDDLTSQERSIAILRATLAGADTLIQQAGGNLNSMTSEIQASKVASQELKTALGELFAPAVAAAARGTTDAVSALTEVLQSDGPTRQAAALASWREQLEFLNAMPASNRDAMWAQDVAEVERQITRLTGSIGARMQAEQAGNMITQAAAWSARDAAAAIAQTGTAGGVSAAKLAVLSATLQGLRNAYATARGMAAAFNAEISNKAFIGGVDVLSEQQYLGATQARNTYEQGLQIQLKAGIITQEQLDYKLAAYDQRVQAHIGTLRDATKATTDYSSAMTDTGGAYDDLKSRISGALRPTFDLSGLTGGAMGGAMGDTFDEAYKRLAAVALRPEELQIHAGDWADTFEKAGLTGLSPEEAQQRARELVEAYSKGLDFSLIDREKIKDSVRQAIKAEEIYNTIVDEIYAEMGKENVKLNSAGTSLGNQLNKATTAAVKAGASDYVGAWLDVLEPAMVRRLAERDRRSGLPA